MTDPKAIAARLRAADGNRSPGAMAVLVHPTLLSEAADAIERMEKALHEIADHLIGSMPSDTHALIGAIATATAALQTEQKP